MTEYKRYDRPYYVPRRTVFWYQTLVSDTPPRQAIDDIVQALQAPLRTVSTDGERTVFEVESAAGRFFIEVSPPLPSARERIPSPWRVATRIWVAPDLLPNVERAA